MRVIISALVINHLFPLPALQEKLTAQLSAENFADLLDQILVQHVDLRIRQRPIASAVRDFVGQALFAFGDRGAEILIKYLNMLNQSFAKILDPTNNLLRRKFTIDHHREVPFNRRKTWKGMGYYLSRSILKQFIEVKFERENRRQFELVAN